MLKNHLHKRLGQFLLVMIFLFAACSKDDGEMMQMEEEESQGPFARVEGVISCEGWFPATGGCLVNDPDVFHDCYYNNLFTRSGGGWTGGDATYSIELPDGRIAWFFGDTFLGEVEKDRTRKGGGAFLRNSVVIQDGDQLTTLHQGTAEMASSYVDHANPDDWYWPLDATIYDGKLQLMLAHMERAQISGMWSFQYASMDLAIVSLDDFSIESITTVHPDGVYSFGSTLMETLDYTYIYGISEGNLFKNLHVARAPLGDLKSPWEYYNGQDWQSEPSDFKIHEEGVSDQFSVFEADGKFYLMSQQSFFSPKIMLWESETPVGPWTNRRRLYCTPETGGDIITYNAFVHPELSVDGELMISYNINSLNFGDVFENADNYRPKFIRVTNWK